MPTVTVSDDTGQLTVTVDGGEPQPVQSAEDACQVIEATFGGDERAEQEQAMGEAFNAQRAGGPVGVGM